MINSLFENVPGFDQPIAVLKHCHGRIRRQLATLNKLQGYLPQHGANIEAQQAAQAVLNYFDKAAHLHHEDEEVNLMPMLEATAQDADAALLRELVPGILEEHRQMDSAWTVLKVELGAVAAGSSAVLSADAVQRFTGRYAAHMEKEETQLAPMATRLFSAEQMAQLGSAMQARRVIVEPELVVSSMSDPHTGNADASPAEPDLLDDPVAQFGKWFEEALRAKANQADAMSLATVGADGKPSSRIVLVKQFDQAGFTWYTDYDSRKGQQLGANPYAALLFFWPELERQVRIEGRVTNTSAAESDAEFNARPLQSRLAAIASKQSAALADRAALEAGFDAAAAQFGEQPPRPASWGGFRLAPERIEFWQGSRSRFHDRTVFTLQADGSWQQQRLQP